MKKHLGLLHLTDIHLNPLNKIPTSCKENYHEIVFLEFKELKKQVDLLKQDYDKLIVCLSGDIFNLKQQSYYTPKVIEYYSNLFESTFSDLQIYSICGNHDLPQSSYDLINESAYNIWVKATKNIIDISNKTEKIDEKTTVSGIPYYKLNTTREKIKDLDLPHSTNIVLLHSDIFPSQAQAPWFMHDCITYEELTSLNSKISLALLGHIHKESPITTIKNCTFSKPHAFSRMTKEYLSKEDFEDCFPSYSLISFNSSGSITSSEIKRIKLFNSSDFIDFNDLQKVKENSNKFHDFINELNSTFGSIEDSFKIENPDDLLSKVELKNEIREIVNKYLQQS